MKELKRVRFEYKIDGEVHAVRKPSVREINELSEEQAKEGKAEDVNASLKFLAKLGLPLEVGESLEAHMIEEIVEDLSGSKKS